MAILFERKRGKGKILPGTSGEISIEIPQTESMLGLLSRNPTQHDGDRFDDDGWVYNKGQKSRKWFSYCEGWDHFWEPILNDLSHLEQVYHRLEERKNKRYARLWSHVQLIIDTTTATQNKYKEKVWVVHATPYRPENQQEGQCWIYEIVYRLNNHTPSYSMNWVDIPKKFRHLELGNQMYHLERLTRGTMLSGMGHALDMAFKRYLQDKYPDYNKKAGSLYEIRVNGRHYVYRTEYNKFGGVMLEKHVWAGEEYHIDEV